MKKNAENNGLLFLLVLSMASCNSSIARATYTNPVGEIARIGDPYALKYEDIYYLYGTSPPRYGFKVWESKNLVDWKDKGLAFDSRADGNNWGVNRFWAPEVTVLFVTTFWTILYETSSSITNFNLSSMPCLRRI